MKKVMSAVAASLLLVLIVGMVACGTDKVAGQTYVFSSVSVSGATKEEKDLMKSVFEGQEIVFKEDGTGTVAGSPMTWKQDGSKVTITAGGYDQELTAKNGKLTMTQKEGGQSAKITYKKKK